MNNKEKLDCIRYMCETIIEDSKQFDVSPSLKLVLKSILEIIDE